MARPRIPTKLWHLTVAPSDKDPERTLTVEAYICELMETTGRRAALCAAEAGVSRRTVEMWLAAGSKAETKDQQRKLLYPDERRLLGFLRNTRAAHARWTAENLRLHRQIAAGGLTIAEVIQEVDPTEEVVRPDGTRGPKILKTRTKSTRLLPDKRALEWELERLALDDDGHRLFAPRVEVTGAEGGPVETLDVDQAAAAKLIAEFDAFAVGVEAGREREAETSTVNGSGT